MINLTSKAISNKFHPITVICCLCLLLLTACNQNSSSDIKTNNAVNLNLGDDLSISLGDSVELTAQINLKDMDLATYQWIQTSGNTISLREDDKPYISFIATENDSLEFQLIVTDGQGIEYTDSIAITVLAESTQYTAQLSWTAPTINEDGSSITNLAGYNIYYGESEADLNTLIVVSDPTQTSYDIKKLDPDHHYYFCVTAYNDSGQESQASGIVDIIL